VKAGSRALLLAALAFALAALPAVASAAGLSTKDVLHIDFVGPGPVRELFDKIMNVAKAALFLAALAAFVLEFLKPPGEPRNYAAVALRVFITLLFLWRLPSGGNMYQLLAGTVIKSTQGLARVVAPKDEALAAYSKIVKDQQNNALKDPFGVSVPTSADNGSYSPVSCPPGWTSRSQPSSDGFGGTDPRGSTVYWCEKTKQADSSWVKEAAASTGDTVVGALSTTLFLLIFALTGATRFVIEQLGVVLSAIFYLIGPLALVAGIPRGSATAANWFKHFLVYCSWPVFTALIMSLLVHVTGAAGAAGESSGFLVALWNALVFMVCMLSAPVLASQIVGGAGSHIIAAGFASHKGAFTDVKRLATVAAAGPAGPAAETASRVAKGAGRIISNSPGGHV